MTVDITVTNIHTTDPAKVSPAYGVAMRKVERAAALWYRRDPSRMDAFRRWKTEREGST